MKTSCDLCGGIGNQMFMIFNCISVALEKGNEFWFKYKTSFPNSTTRYPYWDTLFKNLKSYVKDQEYEDTTVLQGYFQKPCYFEKYYKEIYNLIDFDELKKNVRNKIDIDLNVVSLHFRLGDYKKYTQQHPILPFEYYEKSVDFILKETDCKTFLYFYEDEDHEYVENMIKKLKGTKDINFISSKKFQLSDWEEMLLMSLCSHNIIANSTFSWWGAYLNDNQTKKVVYQEKWFGWNEDMSGRFPIDWNKMII